MEMTLCIDNLTFKRRGFQLKNINLQLEPGYIYAIAGENGSGKTTLLETLVYENRSYKGRIYYQGIDIRKNHSACMREIGFVSENRAFFENRSCMQNVEILGLLYESFDLEYWKKLMNKMEVSVSKTYGKMSRGERMKFQVAFAAAAGCKLLLLDEATAGMDPVFRIEFFDLLRELLLKDVTVLMTSHNMTEIVKQTDYVAFMENGCLGDFEESMEVK